VLETKISKLSGPPNFLTPTPLHLHRHWMVKLDKKCFWWCRVKMETSYQGFITLDYRHSARVLTQM